MRYHHLVRVHRRQRGVKQSVLGRRVLRLESLEDRRLLSGSGSLNPEPPAAPPASLIGLYTFENVQPLSAPDPNALDMVANLAPGGPTADLTRRIRAASYDSANAINTSVIGARLGQAGRLTEPSSGNDQFGFWLPKNMLTGSPAWSVLFWANRADWDNNDVPFYLGTSDGFGGAGAETHLDFGADGYVRALNFGTTSMNLVSSTPMTAGVWQPVRGRVPGTADH